MCSVLAGWLAQGLSVDDQLALDGFLQRRALYMTDGFFRPLPRFLETCRLLVRQLVDCRDQHGRLSRWDDSSGVVRTADFFSQCNFVALEHVS